ncbi:MAG: tRNA uracil 4-sulfurtransferase ThiI [Oligoflexales bacterium]
MKVLIRFSGEITIKSTQVRKQFQSRLVKNIKDGFKRSGIEIKVGQEWGRIFVDFEKSEGLTVLDRIYGIQSYSIVEHECRAEIKEIVDKGLEYYGDMVVGKSFCVKARRNGTHEFSSMDIQKSLGAALNTKGLKVKLHNPEVCIFVEIKDERCLFFTDIIKGAAGLPLGTAGRAVCLLSGGFDSPVAAWMLQKRGVTCEFLLCNLAGEAYERSVLKTAKLMADRWNFGFYPKFHVVDFTEIVKQIKERVAARFSQVILKRMFYKTAEMLTESTGAEAIITGEAIGQVSSQTLTNLKTIEEAIHTPVMRPLVGFDKGDIIELSRLVGTHDISASIQEFCQLVPAKPATACKVEVARSEEAKLDLSALDSAFASRKIIDLIALSKNDMSTPYIFKSEVPIDAVVVDCRTKSEFDLWHYKNAIHKEYYDLLSNYKSLVKSKEYVLYCAVGMQSALVAEKMQADGFLAYSFQGGARSLEQYSLNQ